MIDLSFEDQQDQLARAIAGWCEGRVPAMPTSQDDGPQPFPTELWTGLADLGVIGLAVDGSGAGALDVVAAMEVLGGLAAPGPLVAAHLAAAAGVADGTVVPSVGTGSWFPWGADAGVLLEVDGADVWLVSGEVVSVSDSIGRVPWARMDVQRIERLSVQVSERAIAFGNLALAAYLVGAAGAALALAAEHARSRRQFGRPIGDFQAVAHPLARSHSAVSGARDLTRVAAHRVDTGTATADAASARLVAATAALDTAYVAHQVFGAVGYTEEAPLASFTRQIRQCAGLAPTVAAARLAITAANRAARA